MKITKITESEEADFKLHPRARGYAMEVRVELEDGKVLRAAVSTDKQCCEGAFATTVDVNDKEKDLAVGTEFESVRPYDYDEDGDLLPSGDYRHGSYGAIGWALLDKDKKPVGFVLAHNSHNGYYPHEAERTSEGFDELEDDFDSI